MAADFGPAERDWDWHWNWTRPARLGKREESRLGVLKVLKDFMFGLTVAYLPCWRQRNERSHSFLWPSTRLSGCGSNRARGGYIKNDLLYGGFSLYDKS